MKATEVRAMSVEDLEKKLADLKKDLFNLRLQNATNQLENPNRINDVKKDIARVKTIIREKQTEMCIRDRYSPFLSDFWRKPSGD